MKPILTIFSFFVTMTLFAAESSSSLGLPSSRLLFRTAFNSSNPSNNTAVDIDAYALFFNDQGNLVDSVGAIKPVSGDLAASYGGDANKWGMETIFLDLALVHPSTQMIALLITDAQNRGFNHLQNLTIELFDTQTQKPLVATGLECDPEKNFTAFCLGVLSRSKENGAWVFYYAPEFGHGKELYSIVDEAYRSILRFTSLEQIQKGMEYTMSFPSSAFVEKSRKVYIPNICSQIYVAAGWDVNILNPNADLDINIHGFPNMAAEKMEASQIETIYFGNKIYGRDSNPIISLDKDNRTGENQNNCALAFGKDIFSDHDDEKIEIDLDKLTNDKKLTRLFSTITVFNDGAKDKKIGIQCIQKPFMRLLDPFGNQIAFFDLSELPAKKRAKNSDKVFAYLAFEIVKDDYGWYFQMIDHVVPADEGTNAIKINKHLLKFQRKREEEEQKRKQKEREQEKQKQKKKK